MLVRVAVNHTVHVNTCGEFYRAVKERKSPDGEMEADVAMADAHDGLTHKAP